jgi:protoheme IX farnesyltransferase
MRRLRDFLSLVKIGVVGSNALTALAGFALAAAGAKSPLPWRSGALLLTGTSLLVGGSCAINNWMDRDLDAWMKRTQDRPTARGAMSAAQALGIGAGLAAAGLALLVAVGTVAAALGLAGALVYLLAYTLWAKRHGSFSLYIGGIAGSVPPLIGWAVIDPRLGGPAWVLFVFLAVWQQAHVRSLALMRADEYQAAGIPMAGLSPLTSTGAPLTSTGAPLTSTGAPLTSTGAPLTSTGAPSTGVGARIAALAWVAAALPLPGLSIAIAGLSFSGIPLAVAAASCALGIAWIVSGLAALRSPSWPRRMFAASLAYLVLVFGGLIAVGA